MIPQWEFVAGNVILATLQSATPLVLGAMGGLFSERSGIINIGIEGMMLAGAFAGVAGSFLFTGMGLGAAAPWLAIVLAIIVGIAMALLHGYVSIRFRADQVVSGFAINLVALGLTAFLLEPVFGTPGQSPQVTPVPHLNLAEHAPFSWLLFWLKYVPVLRTSFGRGVTPFVYLAVALVPVAWWVLFRTPFGLRLRAVGEHPKAAGTAGLSVTRLRYTGVAISGALAGLGGAALSIGLLSAFSENMTAGRGFIALAAMIFGKWTPGGALLASLLFGFSDSIGSLVQAAGLGAVIPVQIIMMLPYVLTMLALAGFVGRSRAPAALGQPYEPGSR